MQKSLDVWNAPYNTRVNAVQREKSHLQNVQIAMKATQLVTKVVEYIKN